MDNPSSFNQLRRASMISTLLIAFSALVVLGSSFLSYDQLRKRQALITQLEQDTQKLREAADSIRTSNSHLREALTASRIAISAFHQRNYTLAVELYDKALAADPADAYVLNLKAYALFKLNRLNEAVEVEKQSVAASPTYAWGYFDLARFYYALGRYKDGSSAEATAIRIDPSLESTMKYDGEYQNLRKRAMSAH